MIEEIHKSFAEVYDKGYVNGYKDAKKKFDRPHGEWETCIDTEYRKCSYCGNVVMLEESVRFHFCPNCGADMRKGGEAE